MWEEAGKTQRTISVSMESGLEDRNNRQEITSGLSLGVSVSMESGLEDRNNIYRQGLRR